MCSEWRFLRFPGAHPRCTISAVVGGAPCGLCAWGTVSVSGRSRCGAGSRSPACVGARSAPRVLMVTADMEACHPSYDVVYLWTPRVGMRWASVILR